MGSLLITRVRKFGFYIFIGLILISCKDKVTDTNMDTENKTYSVRGYIYDLIGDRKIFYNNAKVYLDSVSTEIYPPNAKFYFYNISDGPHSIVIKYEGENGEVLSKSYDIAIPPSIDTLHCVLHEDDLSYNLNQDFIFIMEDNYYLRSATDEITQLTFSNEKISDDLLFFNDGQNAVYTSESASEYHLNIIDLKNISHQIIYSSSTEIYQPRVSPNEQQIYFMHGDTVASISLADHQYSEIYKSSLSYVGKPMLFNDCQRIIRVFAPDYSHINVELYNFVTDESILITTGFEIRWYFVDISRDDKYVSSISGDYIVGWVILNTQNLQLSNAGMSVLGVRWGKFLNDGNKVLSEKSFFGYSDEPTHSVVTDLQNNNEIVLDFLDEDFFRPDYSKESNKYLYTTDVSFSNTSKIRTVKVYDSNTQERYYLFELSKNIWGARFIPN